MMSVVSMRNVSVLNEQNQLPFGTQIDEGSEESHTQGKFFKEIVEAQTILN